MTIDEWQHWIAQAPAPLPLKSVFIVFVIYVIPFFIFQWTHSHFNIFPDKGAVEPRSRTVCRLFHCHCAWLHQPVCCRQLRQRRHCHICSSVYLLSMGMFQISLLKVCPTIDSLFFLGLTFFSFIALFSNMSEFFLLVRAQHTALNKYSRTMR